MDGFSANCIHYLPWEANMATEIIKKHLQHVLPESFSIDPMAIFDYRRYFAICSHAEVVTPSLKMNELKQPQSEATETFLLFAKHPQFFSGMVPMKGSVFLNSRGTQGGIWYPAGTCCLGLVALSCVALSCVALCCLVVSCLAILFAFFFVLSCLVSCCLMLSCPVWSCLDF